jgi:hypothetical protein
MYYGLGEFDEEDFLNGSELELYETRILQQPPPLPDGAGPVDIWAVHGISLIICWGVLNFIGYCAARFLKHYTWWIYVHFAGSILPALWTFGMIIATLIISKYYITLEPFTETFDPDDPATNQLHFIIGLIFFSFIIIEIILGAINWLGTYFNTNLQSNIFYFTKLGHKVIYSNVRSWGSS